MKLTSAKRIYESMSKLTKISKQEKKNTIESVTVILPCAFV